MLTILFENADLLAIAKPSGLLSIPDGFNPDLPNARDILAQDFGKLWTVHRLDKDTSGILLFAKNAEAHRELNEQFTHHSIKKSIGPLFWEVFLKLCRSKNPSAST